MVGLMGAGKSSIGRRLAKLLEVPFVDADSEIEAAAGCTITELFESHGEDAFRDGERRVIERLLNQDPHVLATGGGAFMNEATRAIIKQTGISVWLRADLDLLMERVLRRDTRPLLRQDDPRKVMQRLMDERYPVYAQADLIVDSVDAPHEVVVNAIVDALNTYYCGQDR